MTLVRNRLPQLNGNRRLVLFRMSNFRCRIYLFAVLLAFGCSPKVRQVSTPVNKSTEQKPAPVEKPTAVKPLEAKVSTISLLLPFGLDHIVPGRSYTDISLKKARIAADYYRGFKLALDSLTSFGYNYKLQLFDTRDDPATTHSLAYNPKVRASDLLVGPVFPDDMKALTSVLTAPRKPIVSPLSPEPAGTFHNPNLVIVNPPLEYHAWRAADYINDKINPKKVFILKSGYSEENKYISFFTKALYSLSKKHIKVITVTIVRGKLDALIPQLTPGKPNVFIIPSTDQAFLTITLHSLDLLSAKYPITLFGHPSWQHFSFLRAAVLQHLKTHITSADDVDYKSAETTTFIRSYRNAWHTEPSAYAIKGFDEGLYFGRLLGEGNFKNIGKDVFSGLHNNFHFEKKPGLGFINTHVNLLLYDNFELKKVE
jgi:ABC-type branched-subunit amino acid transport system substrate-binding protein